jgi:hypothetical protein
LSYRTIGKSNVEDGSLRMTAIAYDVLAAICAALAENQVESRLIVTCRYFKEDTLPPHRLHLESLAAMGKADIDKIVRDLDTEVKEKLPVTEEIVRDVAFSHDIVETRNFASLHRLVALSLVESPTVYATQQPEYRVTTILELLLQSVLTEEEWQTTRKAPTQSIYLH